MLVLKSKGTEADMGLLVELLVLADQSRSEPQKKT